jgi:D-alanyl-D-alanine carboxypeptidase (penicillin-binding protein 5/6)
MDTINVMMWLFLFPMVVFAASLSVTTSSPFVCAMNAETGDVIYQKNMDQRIYPGSVTKLALALYLLEECEVNIDQQIVCDQKLLKGISAKVKEESSYSLPPYLLEYDGVSIYLRGGEKIAMKDLLYALIVKSANDAANVLAGVYFESIESCMFHINTYLRRIGCKNTHFLNPHGLHHPEHVSSPFDLAIILQKALSHPILVELISTLDYQIPKTNFSPSRALKNSNRLIDPQGRHFLPYVIGGKTGYHKAAKHNIAVYGKKGERALIVVVNKAENRFLLYDDCSKVFTAAFEEKKERRFLFNKQDSAFSIQYPWANKALIAKLGEDCIIEFYPSEEKEFFAEVNWNEIKGPLDANSLVATLDVYSSNYQPIAQYPLFAKDSIGYCLTYRISLILNKVIQWIARYPFLTLTSIFILFFLIPKRGRKVV